MSESIPRVYNIQIKTDDPFSQEAGIPKEMTDLLIISSIQQEFIKHPLAGLILDPENTVMSRTVKAPVSWSLLVNQGGHRQ